MIIVGGPISFLANSNHLGGGILQLITLNGNTRWFTLLGNDHLSGKHYLLHSRPDLHGAHVVKQETCTAVFLD